MVAQRIPNNLAIAWSLFSDYSVFFGINQVYLRYQIYRNQMGVKTFRIK